MLQQFIDGILRPVAYMSKQHLPTKCNYKIYDKEMLAIIKALDEWDAELQSVKAFTIITDHHNLKYFMSTQKLTERQMRWANTLSKYDFKIAYTLGKLNTIPDILSRRLQDIPDGQDKRVLA